MECGFHTFFAFSSQWNVSYFYTFFHSQPIWSGCLKSPSRELNFVSTRNATLFRKYGYEHKLLLAIPFCPTALIITFLFFSAILAQRCKVSFIMGIRQDWNGHKFFIVDVRLLFVTSVCVWLRVCRTLAWRVVTPQLPKIWNVFVDDKRATNERRNSGGSFLFVTDPIRVCHAHMCYQQYIRALLFWQCKKRQASTTAPWVNMLMRSISIVKRTLEAQLLPCIGPSRSRTETKSVKILSRTTTNRCSIMCITIARKTNEELIMI